MAWSRAMLSGHSWLLFWAASTFIQAVGLGIAIWSWWQSTPPGWSWFWLAFVGNWAFTLAHQAVVGVYAPELASGALWSMAVFKLAAMVCELAVMLLARQLATPPRSLAQPGHQEAPAPSQ